MVFSSSDKFTCEEQYCSYVATQIPWYKEVTNKNVIKYLDDNYYFEIPAELLAIAELEKSIVFKYSDTNKIIFRRFNRDDFSYLRKFKDISLIDIPDILFARSSKSVEKSASPGVKEIFLTRGMEFKTKDAVVYMKKDNLIAYVITGNKNPYDFAAYIVNKGKPDELLKVEIYGFDKIVLKRIISSISKR